jgi:ELWxxDGT repeat protein
MKIPRWLLALALLLLAAPVLAGAEGPAYLVKDLKTVGVEPLEPGSGADFSSYLTVNGRVIFFGFLHPWSDCGLWVTDGHPGGAERIVNLCGTVTTLDGNSRLRMDASTGSVAWFEDVSGLLWRTDGTSAGTYPLGVQVSGQYFDTPPALGPDGALYFSGCAPGEPYPEDCEPWRSDGTLQGTRLLRDIHPGPGGSRPSSFTPEGRRVLFIANGGLWSTDGTTAGTQELVRLPGLYSYIDSFLVKGDQIYILANANLWVFDRKSGTSRLIRGFPEEFGSHLNVITGVTLQEDAGRVLLYQFDENHSPFRFSLWETDGTRAGTRRFGSPNVFNEMDPRVFAVGGGHLVLAAALGTPGTPERLWSIAPGSRQPVLLTGCPGRCPQVSFDPAVVWHDRLYFAGMDARHGRELWTTDGTAQGTRMIADLCPGACDGGPMQLRVALDRLVFTDPKGDLWASDGTAEGTVRLADTGNPYPSIYLPLDLTELGGRIVFTGLDPAGGRQPFASDLTPQGTDVLDRIGGRVLAASSQALGLAAAGSRAVFYACDDRTGGLWGSDGTEAGTVLLPGTEGPCEPHFGIFQPAGGLAYFDFDGGLWRTDGTPGGTIPLLDSGPIAMAPLGGRLLFVVDPAPGDPPDPDTGRDFLFYTTDGTPQGTREAFSVRFPQVPNGYFFTGLQGLVFFLATTPSGHFGLWRTDGTAAGTFPLLDALLPIDSQRYEAAVLNGKTYFLAAKRKFGYTLWVNDGTPTGTTPVLSDASGPRPVSPYGLTAFRGALYFFDASGQGGNPELWRTDGTAAGTHLVMAFPLPPYAPPAYDYPDPGPLTPVGDQLFFRADTLGHGRELWKTDGTPEGTVLVKDIAPGPATSRLTSLTAAGGRLYFTADDGEHGNELWESDGTAAGTRLVQDILPGPASSDPQDLTAAEGILYFTANDGEHGRELWALPLPR